jgi:hypothetical protein
LWGPTDIRPDWLRISFDSPRPPKVEFQKKIQLFEIFLLKMCL